MALLIQSATLCSFFYWCTVRQATDAIDNQLVSDCSTFEKLKPLALIFAINGMVSADLHRTRLAGVFGPTGNVVAGNIATLPSVLMGGTPLLSLAWCVVHHQIRDRIRAEPFLVRLQTEGIWCSR
jgi:hypothetical protein